jgi:hypothetical protein
MSERKRAGGDDMKRFRIRARRGWRSVPTIIATVIVAAAVLAPTVSGAAAFLTKKRAEKRYLGNTTISRSTTTVPNGDLARITVTCPPGFQAIGGGAESPAFFPDTTPMDAMIILENKPMPAGPKPTSWEVEVANLGGSPQQISAQAVCSK